MRIFVFAQSEEDRLAQFFVARPLGELELGD
jgi:hypothetical protein